MREPTESDPTAGIRAVFLAGFFTGNACGLLYLAITGHLWESFTQNPLALFGAFLGIGLVGSMIGGVCGLSLKLLLGKGKPNAVPVVVAGVASAALGLWITTFLVAALWSS
jgi:hypothetical protein